LRITFIVLGLLLLTSCGSPDRQAAMRTREAEHQQQQAEALRTAIQNQCVAYGHPPGTDAFAACVQAEHQRQQADVRTAIQAQHEQRVNAASRQCLSGIQQSCWELRNLQGH
jgi:hypothetical protein